MGGIQLQLAGDSGDLDLPPMMRHQLRPGEAYVEWIACHPDATGKGIGSRLLRWADAFAKSQGATVITLDVMKKNAGAVKLYERKGYVIQKQGDAVDRFFTGLCVWATMGGKYWT